MTLANSTRLARERVHEEPAPLPVLLDRAQHLVAIDVLKLVHLVAADVLRLDGRKLNKVQIC